MTATVAGGFFFFMKPATRTPDSDHLASISLPASLSASPVSAPLPIPRKPASEEKGPRESPQKHEQTIIKDPYATFPVVDFLETIPDENGEFTRLRVVETEMKYPYVRVEEKLRKNPETGEEVLLERVTMAADHLLVRLHSGYTLEHLIPFAAAMNFQILNPRSGARFYLLKFEARDVGALERAMEQVKASPIVSYVEPDYLTRK